MAKAAKSKTEETTASGPIVDQPVTEQPGEEIAGKTATAKKMKNPLTVEIATGNFLDLHFTDSDGEPANIKLLPGEKLTLPGTQKNLDALKPFFERNLIIVSKS